MLGRFPVRIAGAICIVVITWFLFSTLGRINNRYQRITQTAKSWKYSHLGQAVGEAVKVPAKTSAAGAASDLYQGQVPNAKSAIEQDAAASGPGLSAFYRNVPRPVLHPERGDKVIVMGKLEREDTSWVDQLLPEWQNAIYTVDNNKAELHTPRNKGREANPYLLYLITNYDELPSTIVFLHPHRDGYPAAWHNDVPNYDNSVAMDMLNIDYIQQNGYVNLRCNWEPGCPDAIRYKRNPTDPNPDRRMEHHMEEVWHHFFGNTSGVPEVIATPCCAQFAVSRTQVHKRPLAEYVHFHQWLMNTDFEDDLSGRMFEYLWHVIFGQDPVFCPRADKCYKNVYGRHF